MFRKQHTPLDLCPDQCCARLRACRLTLPNLLPSLTVLALIAASGGASAQVSGSVSLVSDYIYRGVSLSKDNPEAQLNLNADFDSGWFVGAFASPVDLPGTHGQAIGYGGYARQWTSDLSWEAGVSETAYTNGSSQNYSEVFVGLSSNRFNGRLYYWPNYLGQSVHSVYGEINVNQPLTSSLRLNAHAGYLNLQQQEHTGAASHDDLRVGLAYHAGDWNLQWGVASVRETATETYYYQHVTRHYTGVFDASWHF